MKYAIGYKGEQTSRVVEGDRMRFDNQGTVMILKNDADGKQRVVAIINVEAIKDVMEERKKP